jgi:putative oxidoreductase
MTNGINDELTLAARLLLATLFLIFGCRKLRDYSGTVSQMVRLGAPMPVLAAAVATFMELPVALARSRVLRLYLCFSTRWELRSLGIAIGQ